MQIPDRQIDLIGPLLEELASLDGIVGKQDAITVGFEQGPAEIQNARLVIDDQDGGGRFHSIETIAPGGGHAQPFAGSWSESGRRHPVR